MKVLIIQNIPSPYRIPLFNLLDRELAARGHELLVVFGSKGYAERFFEPDLEEIRFRYRILQSKQFRSGGKAPVLNYRGVCKEMRRFRPDRIVVIGYSIATLKTWIYTRFHSASYLIWSGTIPSSKYTRIPLRILLRKFLLKGAAGALAYGTLARQYFLDMGVPGDNVHVAINSVDTAFFFEETEKIRRDAKLESDGKKHLTCISYLTQRKNIMKVLQIVRLLSGRRDDFVVDIIGDGPEKENLESFTRDNQLIPFVNFHGFRQKADLPRILASSHCFLFQTDYDIWGLVLNEAMAAGVACLSSVNAGATYDLVKDGETGFAVNFDDGAQVAAKIEFLLDHPEERKRIADNARQFILNHASLSNSVVGFIDAIDATHEKYKKR
jgi:glycosyltransferase involved in cell wall biosynthesis